jgi:hypothetical protein
MRASAARPYIIENQAMDPMPSGAGGAPFNRQTGSVARATVRAPAILNISTMSNIDATGPTRSRIVTADGKDL